MSWARGARILVPDEDRSRCADDRMLVDGNLPALELALRAGQQPVARGERDVERRVARGRGANDHCVSQREQGRHLLPWLPLGVKPHDTPSWAVVSSKAPGRLSSALRPSASAPIVERHRERHAPDAKARDRDLPGAIAGELHAPIMPMRPGLSYC